MVEAIASVIRSDATYIYVPSNHSLFLWKTGNYLYLGHTTGAPIKLGLVWNQSITADEKAAMAEIGMIAQNVYFDANALNLAALTTGMSVNDLYELDLPANEKPEIIMHVGHPPSAYDFYYNPLPQSNLPRVQNNTLTLAEAVNTRQIAFSWNDTELSALEQSQVLWASYGPHISMMTSTTSDIVHPPVLSTSTRSRCTWRIKLGCINTHQPLIRFLRLFLVINVNSSRMQLTRETFQSRLLQ